MSVGQVEHIWVSHLPHLTMASDVPQQTKLMSIVALIYFIHFTAAVLLRNQNTSNDGQLIQSAHLAVWWKPGLCIMQLYVLYNCSKRILFIMVLGFIIEVVGMLVTEIQVMVFDGMVIFDNPSKQYYIPTNDHLP
ncbi:hypothetical protein V8B97DRAFT_1915180 [Scleroderma yunnanense]